LEFTLGAVDPTPRVPASVVVDLTPLDLPDEIAAAVAKAA
jgi:hypothetical protein